LWLQTHSVPPKEKSLFSQLKGTGSFGERVARRLESDYGMGAGYLDRPMPGDSSNTSQKAPLSNIANAVIQCVERLDGLGEIGKKILSAHLDLLAIAEPLAGMQYAEVVRALHVRKQKLADHGDLARDPHVNSHERKRRN